MSTNLQEKVKQAIEYIKTKTPITPSVMMILGSGMGEIVEQVEGQTVIQMSEIPNFPRATAEGHAGRLVFGQLRGKPVAVMQGRFHYYEGYAMEDVTLPIHVIHTMGAKTLVVTNAVGGINAAFAPGDIMLITDHINLMGVNPLVGMTAQVARNQFPDMTNAYAKQLQNVAQTVAQEQDIPLKTGVYIAVSGPSYETRAEIRAFRQWGADAVGMSTVPEVIVANYHRMQVVGLSCIANPAADLHAGGMHHGEVLKTVQSAQPTLARLILGVVERI